GDSGLFLAIYAPVYGLGLGATWRQGSDYLAEGLQETVLTMLWVFAVTMIIIQVVCVNYTENIWTMALQQRAAAQPRLEEIIDLSAEIQQNTQPDDFLVVIPDPGRPTPLGMASSPWAIVWQSKRQVVWADRTPTGWDFHTISQNPGHALHWMNQTVAVDDAFLTQILKGGSRLFSPEPFPFLHASQVTVWMSGLPAPGFEAGTMYRLVPGWPKAENPDAVVEALRKSFDAYVARGYSSDGAACLEGIISHHPGDLETYRKLGDLYMNLSIFKRASEIYAKLHLLAPGDPEVVVNLSGAHYSQGNLASAISVCEDFLASKSLSPDVIFNLGGYYQRANRNADALKMYEAYLALGDLGEKREEVKELIGSLKRE
ncbi:MAG: hypothetical protein O3B73_04500, partial [bacterium]|nr:hypothetical protein [bacterium]